MSAVDAFALTPGWSDSVLWIVAALALLCGALAVAMLTRPGWRRVPGGVALVVSVVLGVTAVRARVAISDHVAERQAFLARAATVNAQAFPPGSPLACVDGAAGEAVEAGCEKALFASAETVAAAVSFVTTRLDYAREADARFAGDPGIADVARTLRRPLEEDRYGIAAYVLRTRDGCTALRCDALAGLLAKSRLKVSLNGQLFEEHIARHALAWGIALPKVPPVADAAVPNASSTSAFATASVGSSPAATPSSPTAPPPAAAPSPPQVAVPLSSKYDFPSAASIPPVSIMTPEPGPTARGEANQQTAAGPPLPPRRPPSARAPAPARSAPGAGASRSPTENPDAADVEPAAPVTQPPGQPQ